MQSSSLDTLIVSVSILGPIIVIENSVTEMHSEYKIDHSGLLTPI